MRGIHNLLMFVGDAFIFFGALYLALVLRNFSWPSESVYIEHAITFIALFVLYEIMLYIAGFWSQKIIPTSKTIFELLLPAHLLATVIMVAYFYFLPTIGMSPKTNLVLFSAVLLVGMFVWKLGGLRLFALHRTRAVLIGEADDIKDMFENQPLWNITLAENLSALVGPDQVSRALEQAQADTLVVDIDRYPRIDALYKMMFSNITIWDVTRLREEMQSRIDLERIDHNWFVEHITPQDNGYRFFKRVIDVGAGIFIALLLVVLLPIIYVATKIEDGGPLVVRQQRVGLRGRIFTFYKFRSMRTDDDLWKTKNDASKITRVGAWLRTTRVDEFAQCVNLIRGDVSLVGPRAILVNEHNTMVGKNPFQQARLLAQPGLTGWAQVNQLHAPENEQEALDRLAYDLYYIKNVSLWLDLKIILKTCKKMAQRAGMK